MRQCVDHIIKDHGSEWAGAASCLVLRTTAPRREVACVTVRNVSTGEQDALTELHRSYIFVLKQMDDSRAVLRRGGYFYSSHLRINHETLTT